MQLIPGIVPLDPAQVDHAQGILRALGPSGRALCDLAYDRLAAADHAAVDAYVAEVITRMKVFGGPGDALVDVLLVATRFDRSSSEAWNRGVFAAVLLPALRVFAALDMWRGVHRLTRLIGFMSFHAGHGDADVQATSYAFAMLAAWCRLAPLQAFWSVSFDAAPSRWFDLLLSSSAAPDGAPTKTVAGRRWISVPPVYAVPTQPASPVRRDGGVQRARPAAVRHRGQRAEARQRSVHDHADAAAGALSRRRLPVDRCNRHPGFPALLQRHGLAARCHNVGFVDIAAFAPEIDVHLDSFPYGTAEAALRMLAHGCPTVGMAVKDSLHGYVYGPLLAHGFDDPLLGDLRRAP